ncbi:putative membrane protein [Bradyrhizobium sp. JR7.2]
MRPTKVLLAISFVAAAAIAIPGTADARGGRRGGAHIHGGGAHFHGGGARFNGGSAHWHGGGTRWAGGGRYYRGGYRGGYYGMVGGLRPLVWRQKPRWEPRLHTAHRVTSNNGMALAM